MGYNTIDTRIAVKSDSEANWNLAAGFVPMRGELIVYIPDEQHDYSRLKIGDGDTPIGRLPFIDSATIGGHPVTMDTTANLRRRRSYIPKVGEIFVYLDRGTIEQDVVELPVPGVKIGDGNAHLVDLPFIGDDITGQLMRDLTAHINDTTAHITDEERTFWNNKLNCEVIAWREELKLTRL